MEIGTVLPQLEIGNDPETIADYAHRVETSGYEHVLAYDHVLGVNPDREGWDGPYDYESTFHEPLTTFSYLAGRTDELTFMTGILVLPQRQTALVAKQAAQLDLFTDGRFRMGVGVGWNEPEYVGLGADFSRRGQRIEEQVEVLRRLWTDDLVEFEGEFHELPDAGIRPLPVQRPIPLWMGGMAEPVKRRVARLADGWIPQFQPGDEAEDHLADLYEYAEDAGRDPDEIGLNGRLYAVPGEEDEWIDRAQAWRDLGADFLSITTMYQGLEGEEHAAHLERVAAVLAEAGLL
ncbi:LLM class F420-dependent oxidoreductase [Natrinema altunense]|uniref:Luciferase-like monooxygenase n=1 Tax=Natrinema altunense (strain JCM 12890 / CGMCC 1.3731 / AJ2) TaxID=1227494 RepID=M0A142_NATA2|nr:LLM class F420-dependent oxidoreductase [Natrinema altunense]ELY91562.1 luciferase-like monooxygenase [Natrinema altunense JCM 12890]